MKNHKGFTLIETITAAGIIGMLALVLMQVFDTVNFTKGTQLDLEKRSELFQFMQNLARGVDCANLRTRPAGPVEILTGPKRLIALNGTKNGDFTYIADIIYSSGLFDYVRISAAAFNAPVNDARSQLNATFDQFRRKKSEPLGGPSTIRNTWNWTSTRQVIDSFGGIGRLCSTGSGVTITSCPSGQYLRGVIQGQPDCGTFPSCGSGQVLTVVNGQPTCVSSPPINVAGCNNSAPILGVSGGAPVCPPPPPNCGIGTFGSEINGGTNPSCGDTCADKLRRAAGILNTIGSSRGLYLPIIGTNNLKNNLYVAKFFYFDIIQFGQTLGCNPFQGTKW